jgi:hypothetical protein
MDEVNKRFVDKEDEVLILSASMGFVKIDGE